MESLIERTREVLSATPARWASLTQSLSPELLSLAPAHKEWSALECLQHLVDTEYRVFPVRIRAFLAGQDFPGFDPDSQGSPPDAHATAAQLAAEFARLREASLKLLASVTPADLKRQARHAELGIVSLEELLHEWAAHDLMHTVQAERALMQPFIRGCGPWTSYFADHVAKEK